MLIFAGDLSFVRLVLLVFAFQNTIISLFYIFLTIFVTYAWKGEGSGSGGGVN